VKSAIIASTNAADDTMPNCRIGGRSDSARARNPPALITVANSTARPATSSAWRSASSVEPFRRRS